MSSILVYTSPARGHLFPVVGVALELQRLGHEVHFRTLASEVERLRELGLEAEPIDSMIEARELDDWRARNPLQALDLAMGTFADRAGLEVDDLSSAISEVSPDLLLVDTNTWGAQAVAEASQLPWAVFQPYFTALSAPGVPPFGPGFVPGSGLLAQLRDRIVGRLVAAKMAKTALPGINASRRRVGLSSLNTMEGFLRRPPRVIYFTVEALEHPRRQWPESFRFVGPGTWSPQSDEPGWLASIDRPIALVTCSTERQNDRILLESALAGLPPEGLSVVGTSAAISPDELIFDPNPQMHVERFVPHDRVLPHASVAVCHGGMGITQRALAHGVPVVVVPFGRDQLEVGRRVEGAEAGVMVSPKRLTPSKLAIAVRRARDLAPGAARLADAFARAGGDRAAAGVIEELLGENSPTG